MRSVAVLLTLAACGGATAPPAAVSNQVAAAPAFLVWTEREGAAVTRWLDADGTERGHADGLWIADGNRLWRLERTTRTEPTTGCRERGDGSIEPGEASLTTLALVTDGDRVELARGVAEPEVAEQQHGAGVIAGLGRYVFIEEGAYTYGCGAHGNAVASAHTIDLATRRAVAPWVTAAELGDLELEARARLEDAGDQGELHVGETIPVWVGAGLAVSHLLWVDTCYACGNGRWSSYTAAVWVGDDRVPRALADEGGQVPPAVARALQLGDRDLDSVRTGVSWGAPTETWSATFLR